jgi:hypothetical protein
VAPAPPLGDQEYVYGVAPPLGMTEAVPLLPPKQLTLVCVPVVRMAIGWVMVKLFVSWQLLISVTVTV